MKVKKITILSACMSLLIGVGCAVLSSALLEVYLEQHWHSIAVAVIAIVGEKIGYWLIFKFNFDVIGDAIVEVIKKSISGK